MNNWLYGDKVINNIEDLPKNTYGFVYMVTHIPTEKSYIGKKIIYNNIKKKLTKKEIAEQSGPGRKSTTKIIQKESNWKSYYGSAKFILDLIKQGKQDEFKREIIKFVPNKKLLTYYECKVLFMLGALEKPEVYINDNILGKFFSLDFIN